ncbi:MAG: hypothetical protein AAGD22_05215 [Verrucomicrobiota bacterium]
MPKISKNLFTESNFFLALLVTSIALLTLSISQETAVETPVVAASDTAKLLSFEGKTVKVTGKVIKTGKSGSGHNFLNFEDSKFVGFTPSAELGNFTNGDPADVYKDKLVAVTGPIELYQDKPEIVIKSPGQIKIIDPSELAKPDTSASVDASEASSEEDAKPSITNTPTDPSESVDWRRYFK